MSNLWLIRHGETSWSATGRHTGRTDLPLTPRGIGQAQRLKAKLASTQFSLVLTSPRIRAVETCRLAGCGDHAIVEPDLAEWDYGDYEGRTSAEIRAERPGWTLWEGGVPEGETSEAVAARADRVIERAERASGDVALFAHGHLLRVLAARWINLPPRHGGSFALDPTSVSLLSSDTVGRLIQLWNDTHHLVGAED